MTASAPSASGPRKVPAADLIASRAALHGIGGASAYQAASTFDRQVAMWRPPIRSADAEIIRDNTEARARARDLYRNHPYARQIVRMGVQAIVGKKLSYKSKVDHVFLGIAEEEAERWGAEFDRAWEIYAHGPGAFIDAGRRLNFTQQMRLAVKSRMIDGEALLVSEWAPGRRWKTCFQLIDIDRLSNPQGRPDSSRLRAGVVLDEFGAPVAYHIRNGHQSDIGIDAAMRSMIWSEVQRETAWGRPVVSHSFVAERPEQSRGITDFTTVMLAMKQQQEYSQADLASAIVQAMYALVIKSSMDYSKAMEVLGIEVSVDDEGNPTNPMQAAALDHLAMTGSFYGESKLRGFDGGRIPALVPGDELQMVTPGNRATNAAEFKKSAVKEFAAGLGGDPISISQDYSDVNYSSARMSVASNWTGYEMTRGDIVYDIAMPQIRNFMEEAVFGGILKLPKGVSNADFYDALPALARGKFMASGPPMLDPVKERDGQLKGWNIGLDTLEELGAEEGDDWREKIRQKAREIAFMRSLGVPLPGEPVMPPMAAAPADDKPAKSDG